MRWLIGLVLTLGATTAHAQLPEAPRPKVIDKRFVAVYAGLGLAKALDMGLTVHHLNQGAIENNPIFGPHPSTGRLVSVNLGYYAGEIALGYGLKRFGQHHRWARVFWMIEPGYQTSEHIRLAIR